MHFKDLNEAIENKYGFNSVNEGIFDKKSSSLEEQNYVQSYMRALVQILEKSEGANEIVIKKIKDSYRNYKTFNDLIYVINQAARACAYGNDYNSIRRLISLADKGAGGLNINYKGKEELVKQLTSLYHKVKGTSDEGELKNKMETDNYRTNKRKELYQHGIKKSDYYDK